MTFALKSGKGKMMQLMWSAVLVLNQSFPNPESFGIVTALRRIPAAQRAERTNALMIREQRAPVSQSVSQ